MKKLSESPLRNVTFRLSAEECELLESQGAKIGLTGPMHARELVRAGIHQWGHVEELRALAEDVRTVLSALAESRLELRRVALALLVACDMPAADARSWAEKNLGRSAEARQ